MRLRAPSHVRLFFLLFLVTGAITASGVAAGIAAKRAGIHPEHPGPPAAGQERAEDSLNPEAVQEPGLPAPAAAPVDAQAPAPEPLDAVVRTQHRVDAVLDYQARMVQVQQQIIYPNRSSEALTDVVLIVEPDHRPGVFTLHQLVVDGRVLSPQCCVRGMALRIPLEPLLEPGRQAVITLAYDLRLPRIAEHAVAAQGTLGWTPRQVNLGEWLPLVAVRTTSGWHVPRYSPIGEYRFYEVADFDVTISVRNIPAGRQPRVIAPGVATQEGDRLRLRLDRGRSFPWTVGMHMAMSEMNAGGVSVESYYFPEHEAAGKAALRTAAAALAQFSRLFGPYPYSTLRIVEGDFLDGMEYCGLFFLGRDYYAAYNGTPRNYLTAIAAHETAHQWWYCRVGNDPAREPWLDEALATFSELLYFEEYHADDAGWWWDFRVRRFRPRGWVDSSVYEFSSLRAYIDSVYLRGALFFQDLRAYMGEGALEAALREYARTYDGQIATAEKLWAIVERHSTAPLDLLRARYFRSQAIAR